MKEGSVSTDPSNGRVAARVAKRFSLRLGIFELTLVLSFLVWRCGVFLRCLNLGGHIECWELPIFLDACSIFGAAGLLGSWSPRWFVRLCVCLCCAPHVLAMCLCPSCAVVHSCLCRACAVVCLCCLCAVPLMRVFGRVCLWHAGVGCSGGLI